jgi:folate-binding protein YgfZ
MKATEVIPEPAGYAGLRHDVAWSELPARSIILATGRDAVAFVDRFTTAALVAVGVGGGTEAVFADARGWVLALATILRTEHGLEIDAGPAPHTSLLDHLEHYHIREQFELHDRSATLTTFLVAGPAAGDWLGRRLGAVPARSCDHATVTISRATVRLVRIEDYGRDGFLLRSSTDDAGAVRGWLAAEGLAAAAPEAVEAVRIENCRPLPTDIPEKTLPQELNLPARAISFTKGCYLGQETVARLDALGHVNRSLSLVGCAGDVPPPPGTAVLVDGEPAGTITSSCRSPLHGATIAMGILHRRAAAPAARLTVDGRRAWLAPGPPRATAAPEPS